MSTQSSATTSTKSKPANMPLHDNPCLKSPERAFTLQKYLLLHSQHDALQCHLAALSATADQTQTMPPSPTSSTFSSSPSQSPTNGHAVLATTANPIPQRPIFRSRRSSLPSNFLSSIPESADELDAFHAGRRNSSGEIEEEEKKLVQVNQQIKTTLTELLNCESVRSDRLYSVWVQSRLMDAERELKGMRRHSVKGHHKEFREFESGKWDTRTHGHTLHL